MSIKAKIGGGRSIKAVPKQGSSTSIVAPAQTRPQIVPDSVVLGIDTIGNYVQQITSANGIIITQTVFDQAANVVIGHADTSNTVSTTNSNLSYPKNISIDAFGHITDFENTSFNPANFSANSTIISSDDFTIGTTALTLGGSTPTLTGLTSLDVAGPVLSNTLSIRNITNGRILFAGANGAVSDSSGLTFDGTSLIAAGGVFLDGLQVDGQADVDSLNVSDLTQGRIVYAGVDGELIDDAGLTYNGTSIVATGGVFLDSLDVSSGQATLGSVNIQDLTEGRIMYAGANGELIDSANLSFDGVSITATGGVFLDILSVPGQTSLGSVNVTDLTSGRITYAGASGELIDSSNLTFTGSLLTVTGDVDVTGDLTIGGNLTIGDNQADTITVVADFVSDIIPDSSNTYSLGTPTKEWRRIFTPTLKSSSGVVTVDETGGFRLPVGGTADRPIGQTGLVRYNTSDNRFEGYDGTTWSELAGSVKDVNKDTFIRAETAPGDNNDDLDFFTNGTQRLQLDQDGDFKYGSGLNKVTIDYVTGDTDIAGQATIASLAISDIPSGSVVFTGPGGETRGEANLAWDGTNLTIVGGITVDGDFSTSGGLSGDSLSVGNLQANTMMFVSDTGALSSNNNIKFDGNHLIVNASAEFARSPTIESVTQGQVFIAGANGALEGDAGLTYDQVANILSIASLTSGRIVTVGADGALTDTPDLAWDGSLFRVDGNAEFTGNVVIAGNLQLGDQQIDSINVVADFSSDLIPQTDGTLDLGAVGSNWDTLYTRKIASDTGVISIDTSGAIVLPAGSTLDRPAALSAGMVRFNTSDGVFEGYIGTAWASLGGVKDVDQDTYIDAESSPGADNDELRFFTGGTLAFKVDSQQRIDSGANNLVFVVGGNIDVSNTIITGLAEPISNTDAVTKYYVENTFDRDFHVTKGANTYILDLFNTSNTPSIEIGTGLTIESYDAANNVTGIALDEVWQSFEGLREAGVEGTVPNFEFDTYGRVRSLINIPLSVSSNAVVDFVPSIYGVIEDAVRNGNIEQGITVTSDFDNQKLNFSTHNFDVNLTGAVSGSGTVVHNSNTTVNTTFNFADLDERYMNVQDGDTANGDIGATKFVDRSDTSFFTQPAFTSRINGLIVGYNQPESQIQMSTGDGQYQYIYADETKIGFLGAAFNFGTYFNTLNNSWNVEDGSVYSRNFIDSQNVAYLLNPAGQNSRFGALNLDNNLIVGGNLTIANNSISNSSGNITISSANNIYVDNNIITGLSNPVNGLDAVNKNYLDNELSSLLVNGISIQADNATDVVRLGETINFAAGEAIITEVANNQLTIAAELASDSNIGVASFNASNFTVVAGDVTVTILDGGTF